MPNYLQTNKAELSQERALTSTEVLDDQYGIIRELFHHAGETQ
jgi:hypothetical protein